MQRMQAIKADITQLNVDIIVNAANTSLLGGGGVDGAIHRAAGPKLLAECKTLNGCATGMAKITKGYQLPAKHIIHTVGPVYRDGQHQEPELLASCYVESMRLAQQHQAKTIAFPAISCGVYHFPVDQAAKIAIEIISNILDENNDIEMVYFVCFSDQILQAYHAHLKL